MSTFAPILEAAAVHDRRRLRTWLAFAFSAGMVNATALAACQRYVTHVTGTLTRIGADYDNLVLLLDYVLVTLAFVLGAMTSFKMIDGRRVRDKQPWPTAPLFLVGGCLAAAAVLGQCGAFGPFGQTVETRGDFVLLAILAFAMGLQNASVATTTGMIVRTTHMTGPLTDFSVALGAYVSRAPQVVRETARESVILRGSKILAFVLGCMAAAILAPRLQYATFFVPAVTVMLAGWSLRLHLADRNAARIASAPAPSPASQSMARTGDSTMAAAV